MPRTLFGNNPGWVPYKATGPEISLTRPALFTFPDLQLVHIFTLPKTVLRLHCKCVRGFSVPISSATKWIEGRKAHFVVKTERVGVHECALNRI